MNRTRRKFLSAGAAGSLAASVAQGQRAAAMPTERARALMTLFGLRYPIFEAAHGNATGAELAAAVANAGAMGALALTARPADAVRSLVSKVRASTKDAFFVNYILREDPATLAVALDAGAPVVQFSGESLRRKMSQRCDARGRRWACR
jgi:nitronate monooxygenase